MEVNVVKAEEALSKLVVSKTIEAKMNRPSGIVKFAAPQSAASSLNAWSRSITKLLHLVERSCQQIQKESMIHRVPIGSS
jgi:26S proteasome regulatory subunit N5